MAGDDDEMFMTRSLNVTPKTTEQRVINMTPPDHGPALPLPLLTENGNFFTVHPSS